MTENHRRCAREEKVVPMVTFLCSVEDVDGVVLSPMTTQTQTFTTHDTTRPEPHKAARCWEKEELGQWGRVTHGQSP